MAHRQTITLTITDPDDFQGGYLDEWDWAAIINGGHIAGYVVEISTTGSVEVVED
jgi:hypothetical protein